MKAIILTEGGRGIGFGHIARCISLSHALEERKITPEFIINGDESVKCLLGNREHRVFNWLNEKDKIFNVIKGIDIVIIDSYMADHDFYAKISELINTPIYIDDNKRLDYPRGFVVNSAIYAENIGYPENENITYLLVLRYAPLRKEFWNVPQKKITKNINTIMLTFGGGNMGNVTQKVLRMLTKEHPGLIKNVIVGAGYQEAKGLESLKDKRTNLIYGPDAKTIKKIMLRADIAISAAGQTLYELARIGVPTIGVCIADNQLRNVEAWREVGFLEYAGWHEKSTLIEDLKRLMENMGTENVRKIKSETGKKLIDGKGVHNIVKEVIKRA